MGYISTDTGKGSECSAYAAPCGGPTAGVHVTYRDRKQWSLPPARGARGPAPQRRSPLTGNNPFRHYYLQGVGS
ncbi:unnamed protein product [Pieris brassicae]|uniref:Uncharacterized protein n=1 Tax=Pieris brassicae TaxID=7116 RepID=A0A9P0TM46_PIEBR|nr:unnamed protein product [Pieris brassicae]